jgi:cytochrome c peroxidase
LTPAETATVCLQRGLPYPADLNRSTAEAVALGGHLFSDTVLSGPHTFSCATCHKPQFAYADNKPLTVGAVGKGSPRNVPSVVNSVYFTSLFWDGRASSLEE